MPDLNLTWPALLAHWTAFAQASIALPKNASGERWRKAVAPIINLQAVTFALNDLDQLSHRKNHAEHALALDKSEIIIRTASAELRELWRNEQLHKEMAALINDANAALAGAKNLGAKAATPERGGVEWRVNEDRLVAGHPAELVRLSLDAGLTGDLYVPTPGVPLFRNSPAAFARDIDGSRPNERVIRAIKEFLIDVGRPEAVPGPRQVYRQFDFAKGSAVRDLVVPVAATLPSGQPLLVAAVLKGKAVPVTLPPRKGAELPALPVIFELPAPT